MAAHRSRTAIFIEFYSNTKNTIDVAGGVSLSLLTVVKKLERTRSQIYIYIYCEYVILREEGRETKGLKDSDEKSLKSKDTA